MSKPVKAVEGILAQFENPLELLHAAEKMRDAGFKKWDVHSPFPIHGMDDAMGEKRSPIGWIVSAMALTGLILAFWLQSWASVYALPVIVAGKRYFSYMAFFPITFAGAVLFSIIGTVGGLTLLIDQKYNHPVFYSDNFAKASDDGFFISVLSKDPKFDAENTREFLASIGGTNIELLGEA